MTTTRTTTPAGTSAARARTHAGGIPAMIADDRENGDDREVVGFISGGCTPVWLPFPHLPFGNHAYPTCPPPPPPPPVLSTR